MFLADIASTTVRVGRRPGLTAGPASPGRRQPRAAGARGQREPGPRLQPSARLLPPSIVSGHTATLTGTGRSAQTSSSTIALHRAHNARRVEGDDPGRFADRDSAVPPTSSPFEIYRSLAEEITRRDHHGSRIPGNRTGILRGSNFKRQSGDIDENQEKEIFSVVNLADRSDFRPLMYIIPFSEVAGRLREPPPEDKAHPLSAEYIIDRLPRSISWLR
jgi:hypothetical protein